MCIDAIWWATGGGHAPPLPLHFYFWGTNCVLSLPLIDPDLNMYTYFYFFFRTFGGSCVHILKKLYIANFLKICGVI